MAEKDNFSKKMQALRKKKKISLEELAQMTGYKVQYLADIEREEIHPAVSVILSVSQALSISREDVLLTKDERKNKKKDLKKKKEFLQKRAEHYSYEVLTPKGVNKHLNAFKVTIEGREEHNMVEYHHPGEEFVYVLSGELELKVGRETYLMKQNDSQHFDSSKNHSLKSTSDRETVILVTIYSP